VTAAATTCPTAAAPVAVTDYAYDDLDRLIRVTEALPAGEGGNRTTYEYDGHDRRVKLRYPHPSTVNTSSTTDYEQFGYNAVGSLTSHRKRSGETITPAYDNLHRLTSRSYPTVADNVAFAYDLLGRRTQAKYADNSHTVAYVRDAASSRSFAKHAAAFLVISNSISSRATGTVAPALQ